MPDKDEPEQEQEQQQPAAKIIISGAGIVGLVLALSLRKHARVIPEVYEQAPAFHDGVGAAIGMYPNGLRVLRDVSPALVEAVRSAGRLYEYRRWMRHDGTEVAVAKEEALARRDDDLHSVGIRRWKLQKILYDAVVEAGIPIRFGKRAVSVTIRKDGLVEITFDDGTSRVGEVLLGADGARSATRKFVAGGSSSSRLNYTGTTCLFGLARWPRPERGICFPSACTTKCHGCFFPTDEGEQCFQFHFPVEQADEGSWGVLGPEEGKDECRALASRLRDEGWDEQFLVPLQKASHVVRFGFSLLEPGLDRWARGPVVLLGDAAHPPVPYIGQGAQMGIEDAGVIAQLVGRLCVNAEDGSFDSKNFRRVAKVYETMRIPRTRQILDNSKTLGREQQRRADSRPYNFVRESSIRLQVRMHGTLPIYLPGVDYDYKEEVAKVLLHVKIRHEPTMFDNMAMARVIARTNKSRPAPSSHCQGRTHRPHLLMTIAEEEPAEDEKPANKNIDAKRRIKEDTSEHFKLPNLQQVDPPRLLAKLTSPVA